MLMWSHQATLGWLPSLGHPAAGERGAGGVLRYVFILGTVSLRCKLFLSMPFSFACFPCTRSLKDGAGIARWLGWAAVLLGGVEVGRIWSYIRTPKRRWPMCQVCLQRAPHKMVRKVLRATGTNVFSWESLRSEHEWDQWGRRPCLVNVKGVSIYFSYWSLRKPWHLSTKA